MNQNRQGEGGSGSAENKGQARSEQQSQGTDTPSKQEVKEGLGNDAQQVGNLQDTGAFSGRDDLAGGSGDGMESQSTDQETER